MKLPKLSLLVKIMGTIVFVTAVVVAISSWKAVTEIRQSSNRGQYLKEYYTRNLQASNDLGTNEYAIIRMIALDPQLAGALDAANPSQISAALKRLADGLEGTIAPDLLLVSDMNGALIGAPGSRVPPANEWRASRLFQDLREGNTVRSRFAVLVNKGYRIGGSPVRLGDRIVGTALLGVDLDQWFKDVEAKSGGQGEETHRMSFVVDEKIVSTVLPESDWDLFRAAIKHPLSEPGGTEKTLLKFGSKGLYDFFSGGARAYYRGADPTGTAIGSFYITRSHESQAKAVNSQIWETMGVFALGLAVALVMGFILALQITRPLRRYIVATENLSRGESDLSKRLDVESKDEIGQLASNLNRVFAKIHSLAAGVQRTAFQMNASSSEIATMSRKMLDGAKEQAGKVSGSTAAVTELSTSIQQVAENAAAATKTAKQSGAAVTNAIFRLSQIRKTVEEAGSRIKELGESGKRIGNIVEVIRQISEQTSMLALNAAIEAAHAGEHGRGFAVVADEVSSLAKRTGQSARDIEDLIAAIRDQTTEAVRAMQTGTREVEEGTTLVEATLADLKTLISVIDDTASAVQEQAIASDEIARNMDAVQRIAQNVVSNSENAVHEGEKLQHLAEDLEQSVAGFRIDPERAARDEIELKRLPERS